MNIARSFHDAQCLCALLGMTAFLAADERELLVPLAALASAGAWLGTRGSRELRPWALPRAMVSLLVLAAILQAAAGVGTGVAESNSIVSTLGLFLTTITGIKLFDRRSARDDAQLLTLCLLDAIASVLTSNSLAVGVVLLALTPVAIRAAMLLQIWTGWEGDARPEWRKAALSQNGAFAQPRTQTPRVGAHLTAVTVGATLACVLAAAAVFLAAPRGLASSLMGRFGQVQQTSVGFTDNARLGTAGLLSDDPTPVMDVRFTDSEGTNLGAPDVMLYLRGAVKDIYLPSRWRWEQSNATTSVQAGVPGGTVWTPFSPNLGRSSILRDLKISMRGGPASGKHLFSMWRPISITPERSMTINASLPAVAIRGQVNENDPEHARPGGDPRLEYRVRVLLSDEGVTNGDPPATPRFDSQVVRDLALEVLKVADIDVPVPEERLREAALAIRDHLRGRFAYTTQMVAPRAGQDPIEMFLLETRRGHCEYFASAMTAMCQSVGIPARLVLGYVASEYNPLTEQYVVRESNAHAWVEAYIGRGRWAQMDPSPPADIERLHRPGEGALSMIRRWWNALEFSWARSVVSFDRTSQRRLLSAREQSPDESRERVESISDSIAQWIKTQRSAMRRSDVLALGGWIAAGVAGIVLLARTLPTTWARVQLWIMNPARHPAHRRARLVAPFFGPTMRALARAGLGRAEHDGPSEHARALKRLDAELSEAVTRVSALFYRARFGPGTLSSDEVREGQELAATVRRRLRALKDARAK